MLKATDVLIALKGVLKIIDMPRKMHAVPMGTLSIPGLIEKALHLLQFCSCFHCYILLSSISAWTLVSMWTHLARLLCLVLADTLRNPKCKAKLQASTAGIICWNLLALAVGCLLISTLPVHMVYAEGMKYTLELAGRNCCQYYCERAEHMVILSCIPASQLDSHVGKQYAFAS